MRNPKQVLGKKGKKFIPMYPGTEQNLVSKGDGERKRQEAEIVMVTGSA